MSTATLYVSRSRVHLSARHSRSSVLYVALLFCISALLCLAADWRLRILTADDSFIHLRIAQHLMHTGHAFFNLNEKVMVTSSPLWTLLLGLSNLVFKNRHAGLPLEAISMGLACTASFRLAEISLAHVALSRPIKVLYLLFIPCATFLTLLQSSIQEMETPLAVALMLTGFYLKERGNVWWLGILVLAGWTRYEYFLLAAMAMTMSYFTEKVSKTVLLIGSSTFAAGLLWLEHQFATVVPNTIRAKSIGYVLTYADTAHLLGLGRIRIAALILVGMGFAISRWGRKWSTPDLMFVAGTIIEILYISKKTFVFLWYVPLAVAPITVGLALGLAGYEKWLARSGTILAVLSFLPLGTVTHELAAAITNEPWRDTSDAFNIRTEEYRQVGSAVYRTCPNARVMTSEIGALGEAFPGLILDGFGLATPAAIKYHPMQVPEERSSGSAGSIPPGFVNETKPDVIISYDSFSESLRKNYDPSIYYKFQYEPLPTREIWRYSTLFHNSLYVFVARNGTCAPQQLDGAIRHSLSE